MEAYKNPPRKQSQTIDHIKFISHDLFKESSQFNYGLYRYKTHKNNKISPPKTFQRSPDRQLNYRARNKSSILYQTPPNKTVFTKRKQTLSTSRGYDQFVRRGGKSQNLLNNQDRQAIWDDFLKREQVWNMQKKKNLRQKQLKQMARQNPEVHNRIKTTNDTCSHRGSQKDERLLVQVNKTIVLIKKQAEQLRLRLMKINEQKKLLNRSTF